MDRASSSPDPAHHALSARCACAPSRSRACWSTTVLFDATACVMVEHLARALGLTRSLGHGHAPRSPRRRLGSKSRPHGGEETTMRRTPLLQRHGIAGAPGEQLGHSGAAATTATPGPADSISAAGAQPADGGVGGHSGGRGGGSAVAATTTDHDLRRRQLPGPQVGSGPDASA
ncbi:hypothetical protein QJS66_18550 [Kocuria rhizophila]|nr:hypothetical protein QJS66_18550 [Kocuria rhizophila]